MPFKPFLFAALPAALVGSIAVFAQGGSDPQPPAPKNGTAHLWAEVGSFQLEGSGTVTVQFTGTLLVAQVKGQPLPKVSITGKVRKEFESADMGRVAWFGSGKATITGSWRHLTVFGKDMDATWNGRGIAQVFGEFDAKGQTGFITVDGSEPFEWLNTGLTYYVPSSEDPRINRQPRQPGQRDPQPAPKISG
jgi:hypothetical protein